MEYIKNAVVLIALSLTMVNTSVATPAIGVYEYEVHEQACNRALSFTQQSFEVMNRMRYGISKERYNQAFNIIGSCLDIMNSVCDGGGLTTYPSSSKDLVLCRSIETIERFWEYKAFIEDLFKDYTQQAVKMGHGRYVAYFMIPVDEFNPDRFQYSFKFDKKSDTTISIYLRSGKASDHLVDDADGWSATEQPYADGQYVCQNKFRPLIVEDNDLRAKIDVEPFRGGVSTEYDIDYAYCRGYSTHPFTVRIVQSTDAP